MKRLLCASLTLLVCFTPSFDSSSIVDASSILNKTNYELAKLWHLRLGHLPFNQLRTIIPQIDVNKINEPFFVLCVMLRKKLDNPFLIVLSRLLEAFNCFTLTFGVHLDMTVMMGASIFLLSLITILALRGCI